MTDQASLAVVAQLFPNYVSNEAGRKAEKVPLREVSLEKSLEIMADASTRRFGLADFLTDKEFRGDCVYYFSAATLSKVYERFDIDIATPLHGVDENDRPFNMTAMVLGRSRVGVLFDRDRVTYYNERSDRTLSFLKTVYLDLTLSDDGNIKYLASIRNLEVHTGFPYGWEPIEALRQMNGKVQTFVLGKWRSSAPVVPIAQRPTLNSDVLVARCPDGPGCSLPAAAFTPVPLRVDFTSLESLRRMTEMTAPFKGF
ncbi:MAG: hypothetical protein HZB91_07460 [Elusimicrobia bacterium]|nr:hypothetical protein [Elusimicrobiota bacterium]